MFSAWGRFSGVAWGSVAKQNSADGAVAPKGFISVDVSDVQGDPSRLNHNSPQPREVPEGEPPLDNTAGLVPLPDVKMASLPLPTSETMEDFGPLPKHLSDFEAIILNAQEDGTRLPDDSMEDLSDLELPDAGLHLDEVGVGWKEYIVKSGETLSDIALSNGGVTAQDILRANDLKDANRLSANQLLLIPNDSEKVEDTLEEVRMRKARVAALREKVEPLKVTAYVIAQGDSLWSISNSQNIELDTLVGSNTLKSSATLRPGMVLRIPNQDGIFYKLKKGDKLEQVCKRYGVNMDRLRKVNHMLDIVSLKPGDEVFLPEARPEAVAEDTDTQKKPGDDAGSLSRRSRKKSEPGSRQNEKPVKKGERTYRWPVMGRINSPFGWRRHPVTRRRDFHTGIDIKASRGTSIRAARDGRVVYSGWMGGYGKVVVVEHVGGQSTLYAHCSSLLVRQGAKLTQGQNIARVGTTGRSTGPHLHFEVRKGNSPVNPLKYLR